MKSFKDLFRSFFFEEENKPVYSNQKNYYDDIWSELLKVKENDTLQNYSKPVSSLGTGKMVTKSLPEPKKVKKKSKKDEILEGLSYLKSKRNKTKQDKESIYTLEMLLRNMK